jgi:hypothetical protein
MQSYTKEEKYRVNQTIVRAGILRLAELPVPLGYKSVAAVHRAFERCTLPVRVRWDGARYFVLVKDLEKFLDDGITQEQPEIIRWKPRNPKGKSGRPTKAQSLAKHVAKGGPL